MTLSVLPVPGIPLVKPGDDLPGLIADALAANGIALAAGDVVVVAQKIVSKAEGRSLRLDSVTPSPRARELAGITGKDARLVELILSESSAVLRAVPNVLVVRHRLGWVMANAGIDRSNVPGSRSDECVLLLPLEPERSAARLREGIRQRAGVQPGVVISDSFGRPWRNGVVNVALAAAGVSALVDRRGEIDREGRRLEATLVAFADAVCAGAALAMGEAAEGTPVVLAEGLLPRRWPECDARALIRTLEEDLFQ